MEGQETGGERVKGRVGVTHVLPWPLAARASVMPKSTAMATPVAPTSAARRNTAATVTAMPVVSRGCEPSHPAMTARDLIS